MKERFTTIDVFSVLQDLRERYSDNSTPNQSFTTVDTVDICVKFPSVPEIPLSGMRARV